MVNLGGDLMECSLQSVLWLKSGSHAPRRGREERHIDIGLLPSLLAYTCWRFAC